MSISVCLSVNVPVSRIRLLVSYKDAHSGSFDESLFDTSFFSRGIKIFS